MSVAYLLKNVAQQGINAIARQLLIFNRTCLTEEKQKMPLRFLVTYAIQ